MLSLLYRRALILALPILLAEPAFAAERLTLNDALQRVLSQNPGVLAAAQQYQATLGRAEQAGLPPNPELNAQFEDFGGNTGATVSQATTSLAMSQRLELGGKRAGRVAVARADVNTADMAIQVHRQDLVRDTRTAYIQLQAASERLALVRQTLALAQQVQEAVSARVAAGKVSPIEVARATVALSAAKRRVVQVERDRKVAQERLAALWGGAPLPGDPEPLVLPDTPELQAGDTKLNPDLALFDRLRKRAMASVQLSDARRIPDVTLSLGARRTPGIQGHSMLLGASVPIMLFDRNQGERRASRADLAVAEADLQSRQLQITSELASTYQQMLTAYAETQQMGLGVLKVAEQAFSDSQEGYRAGKFSLLDVLDAQRALIEARNAYLDALMTYHESRARLDRLQGRDITLAEVAP